MTSRKGVNKTEAGSEDGDTTTKRGMGLDPIRNFGALLEIRTVSASQHGDSLHTDGLGLL